MVATLRNGKRKKAHANGKTPIDELIVCPSVVSSTAEMEQKYMLLHPVQCLKANAVNFTVCKEITLCTYALTQ